MSHSAEKWADDASQWPFRAHLTKQNGQVKVARIPAPFVELQLEDGRTFTLDPAHDFNNTLCIYRETGAWRVRAEHFFRDDQPSATKQEDLL